MKDTPLTDDDIKYAARFAAAELLIGDKRIASIIASLIHEHNQHRVDAVHPPR